jgi:hypothetical protein
VFCSPPRHSCRARTSGRLTTHVFGLSPVYQLLLGDGMSGESSAGASPATVPRGRAAVAAIIGFMAAMLLAVAADQRRCESGARIW